jgi:hypothetical protein
MEQSDVGMPACLLEEGNLWIPRTGSDLKIWEKSQASRGAGLGVFDIDL